MGIWHANPGLIQLPSWVPGPGVNWEDTWRDGSWVIRWPEQSVAARLICAFKVKACFGISEEELLLIRIFLCSVLPWLKRLRGGLPR